MPGGLSKRFARTWCSPRPGIVLFCCLPALMRGFGVACFRLGGIASLGRARCLASGNTIKKFNFKELKGVAEQKLPSRVEGSGSPGF